MKTIMFGLCLALLSATTQAQEEVVIQTEETPVVYDAPVVYGSQVTYNAPVVYNAPVFYMSATTPASMAYSAASAGSCVYQSPYSSCYTECDPRSPNVIIVGRGAYRMSYEETPNVIVIRNSTASHGSVSTRGFGYRVCP